MYLIENWEKTIIFFLLLLNSIEDGQKEDRMKEREHLWSIMLLLILISISFQINRTLKKSISNDIFNCVLLKMIIIIAMITNCILNINNRTACATLNVVEERKLLLFLFFSRFFFYSNPINLKYLKKKDYSNNLQKESSRLTI